MRKSIRCVKNWVMTCWCGYLSGARCRLFAYGPADATAILKLHNLLPHINPDWFLPFWYQLTQVILENRPLNCYNSVVVVVRLYTVAPPRGGGGWSFPLWVDIQKYVICVCFMSWNFFVSNNKYIARPSSKEPRWYTDNTTRTGGLHTLEPL